MRLGIVAGAVVIASIVAGPAAPAAAFEMTPAVQAELDRQKTAIAGWAAEPAIVAAVKEQNGKGPIAGMDNAAWKTLRRSDPLVKGLQSGPAGQAEFDDSSQTYAVQISVPVLADGKPVGALVVGVNLSHLAKLARK